MGTASIFNYARDNSADRRSEVHPPLVLTLRRLVAFVDAGWSWDLWSDGVLEFKSGGGSMLMHVTGC